jgi:DNA-binding MurR/RpiR family transcriptional regulator
MDESIQTGLRVSKELDSIIVQVAKECGVSKNSATKFLIRMGAKVYQNISYQIPEEFVRSASHTPQ